MTPYNTQFLKKNLVMLSKNANVEQKILTLRKSVQRCGRCGVAGVAALQAVSQCPLPFAARLVLIIYFYRVTQKKVHLFLC